MSLKMPILLSHSNLTPEQRLRYAQQQFAALPTTWNRVYIASRDKVHGISGREALNVTWPLDPVDVARDAHVRRIDPDGPGGNEQVQRGDGKPRKATGVNKPQQGQNQTQQPVIPNTAGSNRPSVRKSARKPSVLYPHIRGGHKLPGSHAEKYRPEALPLPPNYNTMLGGFSSPEDLSDEDELELPKLPPSTPQAHTNSLLKQRKPTPRRTLPELSSPHTDTLHRRSDKNVMLWDFSSPDDLSDENELDSPTLPLHRKKSTSRKTRPRSPTPAEASNECNEFVDYDWRETRLDKLYDMKLGERLSGYELKSMDYVFGLLSEGVVVRMAFVDGQTKPVLFSSGAGGDHQTSSSSDSSSDGVSSEIPIDEGHGQGAGQDDLGPSQNQFEGNRPDSPDVPGGPGNQGPLGKLPKDPSNKNRTQNDPPVTIDSDMIRQIPPDGSGKQIVYNTKYVKLSFNDVKSIIGDRDMSIDAVEAFAAGEINSRWWKYSLTPHVINTYIKMICRHINEMRDHDNRGPTPWIDHSEAEIVPAVSPMKDLVSLTVEEDTKEGSDGKRRRKRRPHSPPRLSPHVNPEDPWLDSPSVAMIEMNVLKDAFEWKSEVSLGRSINDYSALNIPVFQPQNMRLLDYIFVPYLHLDPILSTIPHYTLFGIAPKQKFVFEIDSLRDGSLHLDRQHKLDHLYELVRIIDPNANWVVYSGRQQARMGKSPEQYPINHGDDEGPFLTERQRDFHNCGVFVSSYAFCLAYGFDLRIVMEKFLDEGKRPRMMAELCSGELGKDPFDYERFDLPTGQESDGELLAYLKERRLVWQKRDEGIVAVGERTPVRGQRRTDIILRTPRMDGDGGGKGASLRGIGNPPDGNRQSNTLGPSGSGMTASGIQVPNFSRPSKRGPTDTRDGHRLPSQRVAGSSTVPSTIPPTIPATIPSTQPHSSPSHPTTPSTRQGTTAGQARASAGRANLSTFLRRPTPRRSGGWADTTIRPIPRRRSNTSLPQPEQDPSDTSPRAMEGIENQNDRDDEIPPNDPNWGFPSLRGGAGREESWSDPESPRAEYTQTSLNQQRETPLSLPVTTESIYISIYSSSSNSPQSPNQPTEQQPTQQAPPSSEQPTTMSDPPDLPSISPEDLVIITDAELAALPSHLRAKVVDMQLRTGNPPLTESQKAEGLRVGWPRQFSAEMFERKVFYYKPSEEVRARFEGMSVGELRRVCREEGLTGWEGRGWGEDVHGGGYEGERGVLEGEMEGLRGWVMSEVEGRRQRGEVEGGGDGASFSVSRKRTFDGEDGREELPKRSIRT